MNEEHSLLITHHSFIKWSCQSENKIPLPQRKMKNKIRIAQRGRA